MKATSRTAIAFQRRAVERRELALRRSHAALAEAICDAVEAGASKTDVAKAAGISRPTLYKILARP